MFDGNSMSTFLIRYFFYKKINKSNLWRKRKLNRFFFFFFQNLTFKVRFLVLVLVLVFFIFVRIYKQEPFIVSWRTPQRFNGFYRVRALNHTLAPLTTHKPFLYFSLSSFHSANAKKTFSFFCLETH